MPDFTLTLTRQSTNKVDWDQLSPTTNQFIHNMLSRGHVVGRKDGPGIIAATFKPHTRLAQKNLELVTGLILDIDGKFKRVSDDMPEGATLTEDGKEYSEIIPPDWLLPKLPYCGVAHSSYSHTPRLPKYRVIMPLAKPITPPEFLRLWFWIYDKVEHKVDAACKNPDRMFFLPRCTQDAKDAGWPWLRPMYGPLLDISMVPPDYQIPEEFYYESRRPEKKQGAHYAPPQTNYRPTDAHKLLETLLELPIYSWAVEYAEELKYLAWFGLAANIAAAVIDDPTAHDEGSKALHAISECDDHRYSHTATEKMWHEALKSADKPMKYATLKLNGVPDDVDEGDAKCPVAHARALLIASERQQRPKDLALVSSLLIPGASEEPKVVDDPTLSTVAPATDTPETPVTTSTPPPSVSSQSEEPEEPDEPPEALITTFKQTEVLYDMKRAGWILKGKDPTTGVHDWVMDAPFKDEAFNRKLISMGLPRKGIDDWKMWVPVFNRRMCVYTTHQLLIVNGHETIYNTYRPSTLVPTTGTWDDVRALFLHLVSGDVDALEYTLDWYARPMQMIAKKKSPAKGAYKNGTSIVYRGDPGSGKNTAMDIIRLCFGATNCVTLGQEDLDGRFHSNLLDKLFVVGNEVMSSSNRSAQTANKLKSWVTDPLIPCEGKYSDAGEADNNFNIVFTSNDERPLIIEKGDRRYSVFQSTAIPKSVIDPVQDDLQGSQQQISAFYGMLLNRQIKLKYGDIFHTEARSQVQHASAPTSERFAAAVEEDGFLSVAAGWKDAARNGENREETVSFNGEFFVTSDTLMAVYKHFCQNLGAHPQHVRALTQALQNVFPAAESAYRIRIGNVQRRAWRGLPLDSPSASVLPMPLSPTTSMTTSEPAKINENASDISFGDTPVGA